MIKQHYAPPVRPEHPLTCAPTQGATPPLRPPHRTALPLWLALLLKRQRRADIIPPPWLSRDALESILQAETQDEQGFTPTAPLPPPAAYSPITPPFQSTSTADASSTHLPYHWLELATTLLAAPGANTDIPDAEVVRRLVRDLREVRAAKVRAGVAVLEGAGGVRMNGVGALELGEGRAFLTGVVDELRRTGAAREAAWKEGMDGRGEDDDDEME